MAKGDQKRLPYREPFLIWLHVDASKSLERRHENVVAATPPLKRGRFLGVFDAGRKLRCLVFHRFHERF